MNTFRTTTLMFLIATACEPVVDLQATDESAVSGGGGARPGTTPPPAACGAPECYETNTNQYAVLARSTSVYPAIEAYATQSIAGDFDSSGLHGIAAVTSSDHSPAVIARTTASNGSAIEARATGAGGRPLRLSSSNDGLLLRALRNGHFATISSDGTLRHDYQAVGREGLRGPPGANGSPGTNGAPGPDGADGNDSLEFRCGRYDSCADACSGPVVGDAVGECQIAAYGGGCYYGGSEGRCCACKQ